VLHSALLLSRHSWVDSLLWTHPYPPPAALLVLPKEGSYQLPSNSSRQQVFSARSSDEGYSLLTSASLRDKLALFSRLLPTILDPHPTNSHLIGSERGLLPVTLQFESSASLFGSFLRRRVFPSDQCESPRQTGFILSSPTHNFGPIQINQQLPYWFRKRSTTSDPPIRVVGKSLRLVPPTKGIPF
jgi:hypothetical protein